MSEQSKLSTDKNLTLKEQKWLYHYLQGETATQAARLAGYEGKTDNSFWTIGYENRKKFPIEEMMEETGISIGRLLNTLKEGLDANKVLAARIIMKGGEGEATSQTDDFIDVPDHQTRHKFLETALKVRGLLGTGTTIAIQNNVQLPAWAQDD